MQCSAKEGDHIKDIFVALARKLQQKLTVKNTKSTIDTRGTQLTQQTTQKKKGCC